MEDECVVVCSMDYVQCGVMKRVNGGSKKMKRIPDRLRHAITAIILF